MLRNTPLVKGETYHTYNRGAHKQRIFTNEEDYRRFLLLLHLANTKEKVTIRNILSKYQGRSLVEVFNEPSDHSLVDILGYSLMPNHFHLILHQKQEEGVTIFLRKVLTGYSMYFNTKYGHSGVLFQGRFKSSHVDNEAYYRYIFAYVHLNSLDLVEPSWRNGEIKNIEEARRHTQEYPYSSFRDFVGGQRHEKALLSWETLPEFLKTQNDLEELLSSFTKDRPWYGDKEQGGVV